MSYRRKPSTALELRRFKAFCQENVSLFQEVGLPSYLIEDYHAFIYFLMHGASSPNAPQVVTVSDFTPEQRQAYQRLLTTYLKAGLADPGIRALTEAEQCSPKTGLASHGANSTANT